MNISITNIKINSITNIGSFNVGKTVICRNDVKNVAEQEDTPALEEGGAVPPVFPPAQVGTATLHVAPHGPQL